MNIKITINELEDVEDLPISIDTLKYGEEALTALREFGNYLRSENKYKEIPADASIIYDKFFDTLHDNHLDREIVGF